MEQQHFTQEQLQKLCLDSILVVKQAGVFIAQQRGKVAAAAIEEKSLNSLVSYVDKEAEKILVDGLGRLLPQATFVTEEDTVKNEESDLQWIIDPLDGTTNFLFQLPIFSVSVALRQAGEIVLGIVYEVNLEECFYAWKGGGAYLNNAPISVSKTKELNKGLVATGFPYYQYEMIQKYFQALEQFMLNSRGIRRLGSAAVDLAYVACGRFDVFFERDLQVWDVAAGIILVKEAGGQLTTFKGEQVDSGLEVLATNTQLHPAALNIVQSVFYPGL